MLHTIFLIEIIIIMTEIIKIKVAKIIIGK